MKRWLRVVLGLTLGLSVTGASFAAWLAVTRVKAGELPPLKNGDIIFQASGNTQSKAISLASHSLYTHTGIVEISPNGQAQVIEAVGPVRTIGLEKWLQHGAGGRVTVKRLKGLSKENAKKVIKAAHVYDGKPYDIFFYKGRDAIYCTQERFRGRRRGAEQRGGQES